MVLLCPPRSLWPHPLRRASYFKMFTRKLPLSLKFVPHAQPLITPSSCALAVSPLAELIKPMSKRSRSANAHLAPGLSAKLPSAEMAPTPL